jgi:hypothetical protein
LQKKKKDSEKNKFLLYGNSFDDIKFNLIYASHSSRINSSSGVSIVELVSTLKAVSANFYILVGVSQFHFSLSVNQS